MPLVRDMEAVAAEMQELRPAGASEGWAQTQVLPGDDRGRGVWLVQRLVDRWGSGPRPGFGFELDRVG